MILVHVVQVKNLKNAVGVYKINKANTVIIAATATTIVKFFLDLIISWKFNLEVWTALKLSGLDTNPLLLPILRNLLDEKFTAHPTVLMHHAMILGTHGGWTDYYYTQDLQKISYIF